MIEIQNVQIVKGGHYLIGTTKGFIQFPEKGRKTDEEYCYIAKTIVCLPE